MIDWCRSNQIPFALRSGGHSYEGLSENSSVVIDTRLMHQIKIDTRKKTAIVQAGASLGKLYKAIAPLGLSFPAGSCPTVGISGHVLGGGYGYLARPLGLACDNVLSVDFIDAQGQAVQADARHNSDLFWACRGGGGGSFGVATSFLLKLHNIRTVQVFRIAWDVNIQDGIRIMKDWQNWAPNAASSINALLLIFSDPNGVSLRCIGQSIGSEAEVRTELSHLSSAPKIRQMSYMAAVNRFAGPDGWKYLSAPMKGKSDYVLSPLTDTALRTLLDEVNRRKKITVICDPYGGAISNVASDETAFPHRAGTLFCMQYVTDWWHAEDKCRYLHDIKEMYAAMRPHVSGAAYVNYCDLDLTDYGLAYWGNNLDRLRRIKLASDPDNIFHHAQSVPPA
jgi:FAD/FMN-containing dehydrogenase